MVIYRSLILPKSGKMTNVGKFIIRRRRKDYVCSELDIQIFLFLSQSGTIPNRNFCYIKVSYIYSFTQLQTLGFATLNPTYKDICGGDTGHAEVVQVRFDPVQISYRDLLEIFFALHDPTQKNRQGNDVGTQYRSAIFYHSPAQKEAAERTKTLLNKSGIFKAPIVTEVTPASEFYRAEEYHQKYLKKNPNGYCSLQLQSAKIGQILKEARAKN